MVTARREGSCLSTQKVQDALGIERGFRSDSHPQFSAKWELRASDQNAVFYIFSAELLSFLENLDSEQRWCVEGAGRWLLVWRDHKFLEPDDLRAFLDQAVAIAEKFAAGFSAHSF